MPEKPLITSRDDGTFSILFPAARCSILPHILDPNVPFVWLVDHTPVRHWGWWDTRCQLSATGPHHQVSVRMVTFDLQMPTAQFLQILPELSEHGMDVLQMTMRVPDTLVLSRLAAQEQTSILLQNGFHLRFKMAFSGETAYVISPHRHVLENLLQIPAVRDLAR